MQVQGNYDEFSMFAGSLPGATPALPKAGASGLSPPKGVRGITYTLGFYYEFTGIYLGFW